VIAVCDTPTWAISTAFVPVFAALTMAARPAFVTVMVKGIRGSRDQAWQNSRA
jgi:hypothetical protein